MSAARGVRIAARLLLLLQAGLIAFCIYHLIDAFSTPYKSEWLTSTALVPYLIVAILIYGCCMFLTRLVIVGSDHSYAWLWLLPIAVVTVLAYSVLFQDAIELMGS